MNKLSCLVIGLLVAAFVQAQKSLPSDTFTIVKEYQPILMDANKIEQSPEIVDTVKVDLDLDYSFINKQVPVEFQPEPIKAARIKGEPLVRLYDRFVRLGVGNAITPFGEAFINNGRSKKQVWGAHIKHLNMNEFNDQPASDMSRTTAKLYGKKFWKKHTIDADIVYDQHRFNYYGFYNIPIIDFSEIREVNLDQRYDRLSTKVGLKSTIKDKFNLRNEGNIQYHLIANQANMVEHRILGEGLFSQYKNDELYELGFQLDFNNYDNFQENFLMGINPRINTIGEKLKVTAGLGLYMNATADDETSFHFFPVAEVKYHVLEDVIIPYLGVTGSVQRNNYNMFAQENPFVSENILLINSEEKYNLYTGIRGALSSKVSFNTSVSQRRIDHAPFYEKVLDRNLVISDRFFVTYDRLDELKIKGELAYRNLNKLNVYITAEYFSFTTENIEEAWHRPDLIVTTSAEYNLYDKIIVSADIFYWGKQFAPNYIKSGVEADEYASSTAPIIFEVEQLDPIFDFNLGFEYRYTKRLSAFVKFNNISGINYEKYQDYPTQGFNVWGGLTYAF